MNLIEKSWGAIVKWFKRVFRIIRLNWDLFGGIISTAVLSWLANWDKDFISTIYAIIILMLVMIGLFKTIKKSVDKISRRKKVMLDTVVDQQKPMKAIEIATGNPTKSGEELGKIIIESTKGWKNKMQKIKNFFVWIRKYWQQILGIFGALAEYGLYIWTLLSDKLQPIFVLLPQEKTWQIVSKVVLSVIVALIVILQIRNMCKWVGVGSLKDAESYLQNKAENLKSKLSGDSRKAVESQVKILKSTSKQLIKKGKEIESAIAKVEKEISTARELINLGLGNQAHCNELQQSKNALLQDLQSNNMQLTNVQADIEKYSKVL